jgi:hypothetical protein
MPQSPQREPGAARARVRATPYGNAYPHHQYPPTEFIPIDDMMRLCQHGAPVRALGAPRAPPAVPWTQLTAPACPTRPMPVPPPLRTRHTGRCGGLTCRVRGTSATSPVARGDGAIRQHRSRVRRRPLIDPLERAPHQRGPVAVGQAIGDAKRLDPLLIRQHLDRACPVGPPQAAVEAERVEEASQRIPDVLVGERCVRQRAGAADFHGHVGVRRQGQQRGQVGERCRRGGGLPF